VTDSTYIQHSSVLMAVGHTPIQPTNDLREADGQHADQAWSSCRYEWSHLLAVPA